MVVLMLFGMLHMVLKGMKMRVVLRILFGMMQMV